MGYDCHMAGAADGNGRLVTVRFASFLVAQFLGAANDNAFKLTIVSYVLWRVTDEAAQVRYSSMATLLFPLPFLLFSPIAGFLADRCTKSRVLFWAKCPEIVAMALAIPALAAGSVEALLAVLFLMATHSAFFSPAKYGLLAECVEHRHLSMANGLVEMTTNVAILTGSFLGVVLFGTFRDDLSRAGYVYLAIAVVGSLAALHVPRTPPGDPQARPEWFAGAVRHGWAAVRARPELVQTLLGTAYFSFLGSVFLTIVPVYGRNVLGLGAERASLLLMFLSVGMALGAIAAGRLSQGRVEIGLVPLGSLGLSLGSIALVVLGAHGPRLVGVPAWTAASLLGLGCSAGLFIVPLNALYQQRSPEGHKGRLIAFSNLVNFGAVLIAGAIPFTLSRTLGLGSRGLVLAVAASTLLVTAYVLIRLPNFLVRLVLYLLTNVFYRIEVTGDEHIPKGGALFVANHVSWVDALLVGTASDRMIRFLMFRPYYEIPAFEWFFRRMRAIPIAAGDPPEQREESFARARDEIRRGHVVCIFAEGSITRTGNLLRFRRGFERIADGMDAPIVPLCLDGVWGSLFSWERGRVLFKWPRRLRVHVRVVFGEHLPPTTKAHEVRRAIQALSVDAFRLRKRGQRSLDVEFLRTARRFWRRPFLADAAGRGATFGQALARAAALAEVIPAPVATERIGLLVPPGVPGALATLAVLWSGRTAVFLDADAGPERLRSQIETAGLDAVLVAPALVSARGLEAGLRGVRAVDVVAAEARLAPRLGLRLRLRLLPIAWQRPRRAGDRSRDVDRIAAVVFSDLPRLGGRTCGAELSHHNILSNMESLKQVFRVSRDDRILGVLPFSNSFGLFGTLLLPAVVGVPVVYQDDAADLATTARLSREHGVSLLPVPAAHLDRLIDALAAADLAALRHAVVGGTPLARATAERFAAKFGIEPLEGLGCAECAPLISLNVPNALAGARGQATLRPGTVGQPLPGVAVRIVDWRDGRDLPPGETGELWVSGPNVMHGYVNDEAATRAALEDGWCRTGFAASLDEDGFLSIDRTLVEV